MAMGHDHRHFWNNLVAPVLSGCWCPHNGGRMAHESQRPSMVATICSHRGTALVCHVGRVCFHCTDCILGDSADIYIPTRISPTTINGQSGIHLEDYAVVERRGRFVLLRKRE